MNYFFIYQIFLIIELLSQKRKKENWKKKRDLTFRSHLFKEKWLSGLISSQFPVPFQVPDETSRPFKQSVRYCTHTLLFKAMSLNYFINNWRNISSIVLKFDFNVLFVHSFENEKRYYIVTLSKNDNKTQIKNVK